MLELAPAAIEQASVEVLLLVAFVEDVLHGDPETLLPFEYSLLGHDVRDHLSLQAAARDGARSESVDPNSGCTTAINQLAGSTATVGDITCSTTMACPGERNQIDITAQRLISIPILGDRTVALSASASYECLSN